MPLNCKNFKEITFVLEGAQRRLRTSLVFAEGIRRAVRAKGDTRTKF